MIIGNAIYLGGAPLPELTNPASASDILNGKEVILPDANDQPVKVTGTYEEPYEWTLAVKSISLQNTSATLPKKSVFNIPLVTSASNIFNNARFQDNAEIEIIAPIATTFQSCFNSARNLKKISIYDNSPRDINYQRTFQSCAELEEVESVFDWSALTNTNYVICTFQYCGNLKEVKFVPNSIPFLFALTFGDCSSLSDASIISIANGLKDGVTGQTLTLHATPKARTLEIMGNVSQRTKIINEGTESEETITYNFFTQDDNGEMSLNAFITTVKGWTLA